MKSNKRKAALTTFCCSYAYSVPAYADFTVKAKSRREAERIIKQALKDGKFENVECSTNYDNEPEDKRVFVSGPASTDCNDDTMEQLIESSNT